MTAKTFLTLIKNPEELFKYPEQELELLCEKYPFCQNLILLSTFKKQWNDDEKSFKKQEELAATYSIDRSFLRILLLKNGQRTFDLVDTPVGNAVSDEQTIVFDENDTEIIEEELIEFPSLAKLEAAITPTPPVPSPKTEIEVEKQETVTVEWDHISSIDELESPPEVETVEKAIPKTIKKEALPQIIEPSEETKEISTVKEEPTVKEPVLSEEEMLIQRMKVLEAELAVIKTKLKIKSPPKKPKEKNKPIPKTAKRSLEKSDTIISETLAKILEKQGYFKRSQKMYEQLCLIFPEKSGYFAEKIKNLEDLITNKK